MVVQVAPKHTAKMIKAFKTIVQEPVAEDDTEWTWKKAAAGLGNDPDEEPWIATLQMDKDGNKDSVSPFFWCFAVCAWLLASVYLLVLNSGSAAYALMRTHTCKLYTHIHTHANAHTHAHAHTNTYTLVVKETRMF